MIHMQKRLKGWLVATLCSLLLPAAAQTDLQYWTHQYGAKGLLLNGAVIASTEDETAIFYNPGALGLDEEFGLSLSFLTPSLRTLNVENLLGDGSNLADRDFGFTPGLAAAHFRLFKNPFINTAVTTFTRFRTGLSFNDRIVSPVTDSDDLLFIGSVDFEKRISERWVGLGFAYRLSPVFSVGLSQFLTIHSNKYRLDFQKEIVERQDPTRLLYTFDSNLSYNFSYRIGQVTKLGLAWQPGNWKLGLTFTSPTYFVRWTSASYRVRELRKSHPDSLQLNELYSDSALLRVKTPLSIGFGADFRLGLSRVSIALEYFKNVPPFTFLEDSNDPYDGLSQPPQEEHFALRVANKAVLNAALGFQRKINERTTLLWGIRTDFNQKRELEGNGNLTFLGITPSAVHFSFGGFFHLWQNQFSLGLDFAYGLRQNRPQLVNLRNITPDNLFDLETKFNVDTRLQAWTLVFTYDFIFKTIRERRNGK